MGGWGGVGGSALIEGFVVVCHADYKSETTKLQYTAYHLLII